LVYLSSSDTISIRVSANVGSEIVYGINSGLAGSTISIFRVF